MASNLFDASQFSTFFPQLHVEHHDELSSTSDHAKSLAQDDQVELPRLILADHQTAGRGRGTNRWWSGAGALTLTLLLDAEDAKLPTTRWPTLSIATAMAVCHALEATQSGLAATIKWPNDVRIEGKKVAGILLESTSSNNRLVIGVGLNVNNSLADAPDEIGQLATSMADVAGRTFDVNQVLTSFLSSFFTHLDFLITGDDQWMAEVNHRNDLNGKRVRIESGENVWTGICQGIDAEGAILLNDDGRVFACRSGTVADEG